MKIDLNLETSDDGAVVCIHCGATIGDSVQSPLTHALRREQPAEAAGPGIKADPTQFTDRPILLRQRFCPGCLVCLSTEIAPGDEPAYREWVLS